jgi:hypothetical protein
VAGSVDAGGIYSSDGAALLEDSPLCPAGRSKEVMPIGDPLYTLAQDIAAHLSDGWVAQPREAHWIVAIVRQSDEATIYLERNSGRLAVLGGFPTPEDGCSFVQADKRPKITVAEGRSAKAIAEDIARRFLPVYLPLYARAVVLRDEHRQAEARRQEELHLLAEAAGGTIMHNGVRWYGRYDGKVEVRHGGYAKIEVDATVEIALKIIKLLKENQGNS